jgi:predicted nucleic acid-binding protein
MPEGTGTFLIDSTGWIEHFTSGPLAPKFRHYCESASPENSVSSSLVAYEVYKRLRPALGEEDAVGHVGQIRRTTRMVDITFELALAAADLALGEKLGMADAVLYATARQEKATLITTDDHFKKLPGVRWIDPGPKTGR